MLITGIVLAGILWVVGINARVLIRHRTEEHKKLPWESRWDYDQFNDTLAYTALGLIWPLELLMWALLYSLVLLPQAGITKALDWNLERKTRPALPVKLPEARALSKKGD